METRCRSGLAVHSLVPGLFRVRWPSRKGRRFPSATALDPSSWLWTDLRVPSVSSSNRRVSFVDFWPGFDDNTDRWLTRQWFIDNLVGVKVVDSSQDPDVIVFSLFGRKHERLRRGPKFVFYTGENIRPPIRRVPLCLSFDILPDVPPAVHTRLPLWVLNVQIHDVIRMHEVRLRGAVDRTVWDRKGFCSFVASNSSLHDASVRTSFVVSLSAYKRIACGGTVLNNMGGCVKDKIEFMRGYRFNVAYENSSHPGYCTEKLLHAFAAGCVPIYWGDPRSSGCAGDFNPAALICAHRFSTTEQLMEHIRKVDADRSLFESYLSQPILSAHWYERLRNWPSFCHHFTELLFSGPPLE